MNIGFIIRLKAHYIYLTFESHPSLAFNDILFWGKESLYSMKLYTIPCIVWIFFSYSTKAINPLSTSSTNVQ